MAYETRDDWSGDDGRHRTDVHYRLYAGRGSIASIVCTQDFDYLDYDARRMLSREVFDTEAEAERALIKLLPHLEVAERRYRVLPADLRARCIAVYLRDVEEGRR